MIQVRREEGKKEEKIKLIRTERCNKRNRRVIRKSKRRRRKYKKIQRKRHDGKETEKLIERSQMKCKNHWSRGDLWTIQM